MQKTAAELLLRGLRSCRRVDRRRPSAQRTGRQGGRRSACRQRHVVEIFSRARITQHASPQPASVASKMEKERLPTSSFLLVNLLPPPPRQQRRFLYSFSLLRFGDDVIAVSACRCCRGTLRSHAYTLVTLPVGTRRRGEAVSSRPASHSRLFRTFATGYAIAESVAVEHAENGSRPPSPRDAHVPAGRSPAALGATHGAPRRTPLGMPSTARGRDLQPCTNHTACVPAARIGCQQNGEGAPADFLLPPRQPSPSPSSPATSFSVQFFAPTIR